MYLKNTFRLVFANLNLVFKAVLYRLVVVTLATVSIYVIVRLSIHDIVHSAEMSNLIGEIKGLWQHFIGADISKPIELSSGVSAVLGLIKRHAWRMVGSGAAIFFVVFLMNYLMGLCNYTIGVMLDRHMSTITRSTFFQTFFEVIKRAAPFELFYAALKLVVDVLVGGVFVAFVVFTGPYLSVLSVLFGLWIVICLLALFYTVTCRLHPSFIHGKTFKKSLACASTDKKNFLPTFGCFVFMTVLIVYINVTVMFATIGSGLMISVPLSYLFTIALEFVVDYTVSGSRYYIDYDNIVVPKEMRSGDEQLLGDDVDVG